MRRLPLIGPQPDLVGWEGEEDFACEVIEKDVEWIAVNEDGKACGSKVGLIKDESGLRNVKGGGDVFGEHWIVGGLCLDTRTFYDQRKHFLRIVYWPAPFPSAGKNQAGA